MKRQGSRLHFRLHTSNKLFYVIYNFVKNILCSCGTYFYCVLKTIIAKDQLKKFRLIMKFGNLLFYRDISYCIGSLCDVPQSYKYKSKNINIIRNSPFSRAHEITYNEGFYSLLNYIIFSLLKNEWIILKDFKCILTSRVVVVEEELY